jgi:glycosyltransferase involved in cell wall biosynthesis
MSGTYDRPESLENQGSGRRVTNDAPRPRVSAVITVFNQQSFIEATIESVLRQTYRCDEIIVVDDGSSDATAERVSAFGDAVILIRQKNSGVAEARNAGVRRASGDLIAFLDGDDIWAPGKIAAQVEAFKSLPASGLIAVDVWQFDERGTTWEGFLKQTIFERSDERVRTGNWFDRLVEGHFISTTSQVMVPKAVLDRVGSSDTKFPVSSDYDLYLRIAAYDDCVFINETLTGWRYVPTSVSGAADRRRFRWNEDCIGVLRKHTALASSSNRSRLRERSTRLLRQTISDAYYYGTDGNRLWATRFLFGLARRYGEPLPALYALALWTPKSVRTVGKRLAAAADAGAKNVLH